MKYYAVIDTNVLVSAMLKWDSVPGNVLELVFSGTIVPLLHQDIVREYRNVLSRPGFHLTEEILLQKINLATNCREVGKEKDMKNFSDSVRLVPATGTMNRPPIIAKAMPVEYQGSTTCQ